jgi:hypothetical protein
MSKMEDRGSKMEDRTCRAKASWVVDPGLSYANGVLSHGLNTDKTRIETQQLGGVGLRVDRRKSGSPRMAEQYHG